MNKLKSKNMLKAYNGFKGSETLQAVIDGVPEELFDELTGRQLGFVMKAVNNAYHRGRVSTGAEMVDTNAVWIASLDRILDLDNFIVNCEKDLDANQE